VKIDPAGLPFVALAAVPAAVSAVVLGSVAVTVALLLLPAAVALFFRDPERAAPADTALVLSPADGRVMHAGPAKPDEAPAGRWQQVTIFLSLLDVHINRTPVAGLVTKVDYQPGRFLPAYRSEAHQNERTEIWIDHAGVPIVVRQVVGVLARRVVCRVGPGDRLEPGARIGLMKFGSRMDVFVPESADLRVREGDQVCAAVTVIAVLDRPGQ
jgi:phosphatidylserine decarboxylase